MGTRGARWLNGTVAFAIALPLAFSAYALAASVVWAPDAVARGEHVAWLGVHLDACSGCGMCGMSRAFSALAHGDVSAAVTYNGAVLVVYPTFVIAALVCMFGLAALARRPLRV